MSVHYRVEIWFIVGSYHRGGAGPSKPPGPIRSGSCLAPGLPGPRVMPSQCRWRPASRGSSLPVSAETSSELSPPLSTGRDSMADCIGFSSLEVGSRGPSRPGQVPDLEYSREDMEWGLSDQVPRPIRVFRSPSAVLDIRWDVWKLVAAGRCRRLGQSD